MDRDAEISKKKRREGVSEPPTQREPGERELPGER